MSKRRVSGFIGLGRMGAPMCARLAEAGYELIVFDAAGTRARAPVKAAAASGIEEVAQKAATVFLSLPDGDVSLAVIDRIIEAPASKVERVIDLSTVGLDASRLAHGRLREAGIGFIDAPVSGGVGGAKAGTLSVMWAGSAADLGAGAEAFSIFGSNVAHVGEEPGQGQAMKLLNNFLSATAMAATSEAIAFGLSQGLDMGTMLAILNVSTGQNTATNDKFPNRIQTGTFDAGFALALMAKDVALYAQCVRAAGVSNRLGELMEATWNEAHKAMPGSDFTRIFEHIRDARRPSHDGGGTMPSGKE